MVQNALSNLFFLHATDYLRETSNLVRQQTVNDLCYTCKGCWQLSAYQRIVYLYKVVLKLVSVHPVSMQGLYSVMGCCRHMA